MKAVFQVIMFTLKSLAWLLVILVPAIGVWVASSLAAYLNGPVWLAVVSGALLFPVVPLVWDMWATSRFEKRMTAREDAGKERRDRFVTFGDRMILRTFFLNIGFIAALLATYPQAGFTALASRGDWFLDTGIAKPATAEEIRPVLFAGAEKLEWVYEWSRENPYEEWKDDEPLPTPSADEFGSAKQKVGDETPKPDPGDEPTGERANDDDTATDDANKTGDQQDEKDSKETGDADDPDDSKTGIDIVDLRGSTSGEDPGAPSRAPGEPPAWPMAAELHPVVRDMPESVKTDYGAVARYIKDNEPDPFLRVKALHDFVADRVAYDGPSYVAGEYPPQDAKTVFDTGLAVCAGYSKLLEAMGKITGDEIVYVVGVSRDEQGGISGGGHAWNAAKIEGKWYLIDATWNAGSLDGSTFKKRYKTSYLFTPPEVFSMNHLPDDEAWQLRKDPITRGEFVRQPMMRSEFYAQGLELVSPQRSQFESSGPVSVALKNPRSKKVLATMVPLQGGQEARCSVSGGRDVRINCPVPGRGRYHLRMFAGPPSDRTFQMVGKFEVVAP